MSDRTPQSPGDMYKKARREGVERERAEGRVQTSYSTWNGPLPAERSDAWERELNSEAIVA